MTTLTHLVQREQNNINQIKHDLQDKYVGRDVVFLHGKFKGRRGRIHQVTIINSDILFLAYPYRLNRRYGRIGEDTEFLTDDPAARSYLHGHWFVLAD